MGWVQVAIEVAQLAAAFLPGLFGDKKAGYKALDKTTDQIVASYGLDIVAGAQAAGVDPSQAATAAADYAKAAGINVTPAQLLAQHVTPASIITNNLPTIVTAGGGLLALFLLLKKGK